MRRASVLLVALMALGGCVTAEPIRKVEPALKVSGLTGKTVTFKGLINEFPLSHRIGTIETGLACVGTQEMRFTQAGELPRSYADRFYEEARRAGLSVIGDKGAITAQEAVAAPPAAASDLAFAGTIKHIVWNSCVYTGGPETSGEASIEVEWVVFDERANRVVMTLTTPGAAKRGKEERGGLAALMDAYGDTIRRLFLELRRAQVL
jgi:hypothetical protein